MGLLKNLKLYLWLRFVVQIILLLGSTVLEA